MISINKLLDLVPNNRKEDMNFLVTFTDKF